MNQYVGLDGSLEVTKIHVLDEAGGRVWRRTGGGGIMADGKDSAEVVKFLSLYSRLKDWCDDDPDAIFQLAVADTQF